MPSFQSVADELTALTDARSQSALRALAKSIRDLEARILSGVGSQTEWDIRTLNQLISMTQGALRDSGFDAIADHFGQAAVEMAQTVDGISLVTLGADQANLIRRSTRCCRRAMRWCQR